MHQKIVSKTFRTKQFKKLESLKFLYDYFMDEKIVSTANIGKIQLYLKKIAMWIE